MAYIDVLPLADMKTYLHIDDTNSAQDSEITMMIGSAFRYIERHTGVVFVQQATKEYIVQDRCVNIYDTPINSVVKGLDSDGADVTLVLDTDYSKVEKHLYTQYYNIDSDVEKLVLDVGYALAATAQAAHEDLIDLAKVMVKVMFYEQDSTQSFKEMLPQWAKEILESNRRFII